MQRSPPAEFQLDSWTSLDAFVRHEASAVTDVTSFDDISTAWQSLVHGEHPQYDDIAEDSIDAEFWRAFRMMGRWWLRMQTWIRTGSNAEFLNMGERSRMSQRWFAGWLTDRLQSPPSVVAEDIFSELVFSQHIKVALSRFDGQVQRLRFTLGDSGIIPTTAAMNKLGQSPVRMADRLLSFMGLLSDLDVIKCSEGAPLELGANADFLATG